MRHGMRQGVPSRTITHVHVINYPFCMHLSFLHALSLKPSRPRSKYPRQVRARYLLLRQSVMNRAISIFALFGYAPRYAPTHASIVSYAPGIRNSGIRLAQRCTWYAPKVCATPALTQQTPLCLSSTILPQFGYAPRYAPALLRTTAGREISESWKGTERLNDPNTT